MLQKLMGKLPKLLPPAQAYDIWAETYDAQPANLMIALDSVIFPLLLSNIIVGGKTVADIGCGTGRTWPLLLSLYPARLIGYDISAGMLEQLRKKYPQAEVMQMQDHTLPGAADKSIDLIVSNLTLAYAPSLVETFKEWNRVLKPGGSVIFTTNHPELFQKDEGIMFNHKGSTVAIEHNIYPPDMVKERATQLGWTMKRYEERRIDEEVKEFFTAATMPMYERLKGKAMIYGMRLQKDDAS